MPSPLASPPRFRVDSFLLDTIADNAMSLGNGDVEVREDYSGRGMYGATCIGFVLSGGASELALGAAIVQAGQEEDLEDGLVEYLMRRAAHDSMGRDRIVYFPGVAVEHRDGS